MSDDTDSMPLDGDADLTAAERLQLRRMIRDDERASWARRKLRVIVPAVVAVVTVCYQAWDWAIKHIRVAP
ncbi:MAG TPA: hypothetical protein PLB26_06895 [Rubrivivax sp.]|nr:hypothetical protein [Rubrivivax sp.]